MLTMWIGTGAVLFGALPVDQQSAILAWLGLGPERVPAVIGVLFMAARMVPQKNVS